MPDLSQRFQCAAANTQNRGQDTSQTFVYSSELQPLRRLVAATPFLSPFLTVVFKLASYTLDPVGQHMGLSYCR